MKKIITFIMLIISYNNILAQPDAKLDSLKKYSYLLIGASYHPTPIFDTPNLNNLKVESYATGFFVREDSNLYLISAYHVLTTFDVYKGIKTDSKIDYILVR